MTVLFLTTEIVKFLSHILLIKLYLKQLEQQYQLINEAILALNKQYSNSLTKLILNQNNSSFNPIV